VGGAVRQPQSTHTTRASRPHEACRAGARRRPRARLESTSSSSAPPARPHKPSLSLSLSLALFSRLKSSRARPWARRGSAAGGGESSSRKSSAVGASERGSGHRVPPAVPGAPVGRGPRESAPGAPGAPGRRQLGTLLRGPSATRLTIDYAVRPPQHRRSFPRSGESEALPFHPPPTR
jgi:hypothetical protein